MRWAGSSAPVLVHAADYGDLGGHGWLADGNAMFGAGSGAATVTIDIDWFMAGNWS